MNEMVVKCIQKKPFNPHLIHVLSICINAVRVGSPAFPIEGMIAAGSVAKRQKRFPRFLDPIERWPALPVPRFGIFRRARHRVETVSDVEAFDAAPLVVLKAAQENLDHDVKKAGTRRLG